MIVVVQLCKWMLARWTLGGLQMSQVRRDRTSLVGTACRWEAKFVPKIGQKSAAVLVREASSRSVPLECGSDITSNDLMGGLPQSFEAEINRPPMRFTGPEAADE